MTTKEQNHAIVGRLMQFVGCETIPGLAAHFNITTNAIYDWRKNGKFNYNTISKKCKDIHEFLWIVAGIQKTPEDQIKLEQSIMDEQETTIQGLNGNIQQLADYNEELIAKLDAEMKEKSELQQKFQDYITQHENNSLLNQTMHEQLKNYEKQYNELHAKYLSAKTQLDETTEVYSALACKPIQTSTELLLLNERLDASDKLIQDKNETISFYRNLVAGIAKASGQSIVNHHNTLSLSADQLKNYIDNTTTASANTEPAQTGTGLTTTPVYDQFKDIRNR